MISRVRGTEDRLDLSLRNYCIEKIRNHLMLYNFNEIQTPVLEYTNLFVRSVGESTDIVTKEMYIIDKDKADGDKSLCLRPEVTASIIRACHNNKIQRFPWKVFTYGPMFRYERPQKGRLREFSQVSIENVGSNKPASDVLFIKMLDSLFEEAFQLNNYNIKINFLGTLADRSDHKVALIKFLDKHKADICPTCQIRKEKNTLRIFDCKNTQCHELYASAPRITDFLCSESAQEWQQIQELLSILSVNFIVDHSLVRGLDYYEKIVFEFCSNDLGAQNAFCAGGRYSLGKEVGAKEDFPSIGTAIGIERLILLLSQLNTINTEKAALHTIIPVTEQQNEIALLLCSNLQKHNLTTEIIFEKSSLSNMMKKANKLGSRFCLIIGEEEQQQNTVTIKNMITGDSEKISLTKAHQYLSH